MKKDREQLELVRSFKHFGDVVIDNGKCKLKMKSSKAIIKGAFNEKKELMTKALHIDHKKSIINSQIWNVALFRSETWIIKIKELKRIEAL